MDFVPDHVVDALAIEPADANADAATAARAGAGAPTDRLILEAFASVPSRDDAAFLVEGAVRHESRSTDGRAFGYSDDGGVVIEVAPGRNVRVGEAAFARLMARLADALARGAG